MRSQFWYGSHIVRRHAEPLNTLNITIHVCARACRTLHVPRSVTRGQVTSSCTAAPPSLSCFSQLLPCMMPCVRSTCRQQVTSRWYVPAEQRSPLLEVGAYACTPASLTELFQTLLRLLPVPFMQANDFLGRAYAQNEQDEEAVQAFTAALEVVPSYPPYLARRAAVYAYVHAASCHHQPTSTCCARVHPSRNCSRVMQELEPAY